jgi:hypothetical protein
MAPNVDADTALSDTPPLSERRFASACGYNAVAAMAPSKKNKVARAIRDAIPRPLGSGEKTKLDGIPLSPCPQPLKISHGIVAKCIDRISIAPSDYEGSPLFLLSVIK